MPNGVIPSWIPTNPVIGTTYTSPDGTFAVTWDGDKFVAVPPQIPSNGLTRHFDSLVELQTQVGRYDGDTCILSGYYAGSNVGGGNMVWDATSTATPAGDVVVQVTGVATGRWLMQLDGFVTPEMFGAQHGEDIATALAAADAYCQATGLTLRGGSAGGLLSTPITLKAPFISLANYEIELSESFPSAAAVTYQATTNDLNSKANVSMRFSGNRDDQSGDVVSLKVTACPTGDSFFRVFGKQCKTLLEIAGNVERGEFHVKGNYVDCLCRESGDSPDTNRIYISGGQYKRIYHKTSSTTSNVTLNCQSQEAGAGVYAVEIASNRTTVLSGEMRVVTHGAVKMGGFTRSSIDALVFNNLLIESCIGTVPAIDIDSCNTLQGTVLITAAGVDCQPVILRDVQSANFTVSTLDNLHVGYQAIFGDAANAKTCSGKYTVIDRGAPASSKSALFDRVGGIDVYLDGSALPIDVTASVSNDVINLSVERGYIDNNVAINANGRRVNCHVRGMFLTPAILAYSTPFRGLNLWNVNTNGLCFYSGTDWQRYTTSTLA